MRESVILILLMVYYSAQILDCTKWLYQLKFKLVLLSYFYLDFIEATETSMEGKESYFYVTKQGQSLLHIEHKQEWSQNTYSKLEYSLNTDFDAKIIN